MCPALSDSVIGIYIHQHWPYKHPYCARTWTESDWRGYAHGLACLGFNTVMIWPVLEVMPNPLTASDSAALKRMERVIGMLKNEFGMRVIIVLCPNVAARNAEAAAQTFETRHYFYSDRRVNPADSDAVKALLEWRKTLLEPLSAMDGLAMIDSDPGGFPGSTAAEFVNLLVEHRRMLDQLRPGIELFYWLHAGWQAYCRYYETGHLRDNSDEEFLEVFKLLNEAAPEPWGLLNGGRVASRLGIESKVINFRYAAIEDEPSFPMTCHLAERAYEAGRAHGPRGVMGSAQSHCLQLPNTLAFVRGALGMTLGIEDYHLFAGQLIPGKEIPIVNAWEALASEDLNRMSDSISQLRSLSVLPLEVGNLKGLLFGSSRRFIDDLIQQLRLRAAFVSFKQSVEQKRNIHKSLGEFIDAAEKWQTVHGYKNHWEWPGLVEALRNLNSPCINEVLDRPTVGDSPFQRVMHSFYQEETFTPRLLEAMKTAFHSM